jgi:cytochrome P450
MDQLRRNPAIVRSAVEEFLRFEGPLQGNSRMVLADTDFAGEHLRAGDAIYTLLGCANRDASQFPDPDRLGTC